MNDPLATYLHGHLAGADMAIDLLQAMMQNRQKDKSLSQLAEYILARVKQDRDTLQHLVAARPTQHCRFNLLPGALCQFEKVYAL